MTTTLAHCNRITITHLPTGISATVDGCYSRSEYKRKTMALKLLNSRLAAAGHTPNTCHIYNENIDWNYPETQLDDKLNNRES